jgi:hypothetical protein
VKIPIEDRFWAKVEPEPNSGCWIWVGTRAYKDYGYIRGSGEWAAMIGAHRVSWELHNGAIPDGLHVLHRCDNPWCVNPDHLFLGSSKDNHWDAALKGRKIVARGQRFSGPGHIVLCSPSRRPI